MKTPNDTNLEYRFSLAKIKSEGWTSGLRYYARGNKNEYEYNKLIPSDELWVRCITIVFDESGSRIKQIFTRTGNRDRIINNMTDLNYFFETGK